MVIIAYNNDGSSKVGEEKDKSLFCFVEVLEFVDKVVRNLTYPFGYWIGSIEEDGGDGDSLIPIEYSKGTQEIERYWQNGRNWIGKCVWVSCVLPCLLNSTQMTTKLWNRGAIWAV
ncbi:MAG: hypothetical protein A2W35_21580 [Chloroflexi bacterium RBG_16_57_11]|nr:MAG: hypothetical protein A2W35_21580 [Chloroflexi bacterium RBG_16_57_11]